MPSTQPKEIGSSPRFCYVVLCHDDARAALDLAAAVRCSAAGATVLLRHDRPAGFLDEADAAAVGAHLLRSGVRVSWGGWSLVEAMLEAARHAVDIHGTEHVVFVSGHDRPVRDLKAWQDEVVATGADALLDVDDAPDPARHRYRWRNWTAPRGTPLLLRRAARVFWQRGPARAQRYAIAYPTSRPGVWAIGVRARRDPVEMLGLPYVKASQWMVLSAAAVDTVTSPQSAAARLVFSRTRIPDESYVPTIVSADPRLVVRRAPTTFTVFPPGSASPRHLRREDVPAAVSSGAAFARKVSSDGRSAEVLLLLDEAAGASP